MKCLRCGYCCKHLMVVIIDDPAKGLQEDNLIGHEGNGTPCKHLEGDTSGEHACAVHNERWYKQTPCYSHGQIEASVDTPCRMGVYLLGKLNNAL